MITLSGPKRLVITGLKGCGFKLRINDTVALGCLAMESETFLEEGPLTIFSEVNNLVISFVDTLTVL